MFNKTLFERGTDVIPLFQEADANTDITGDWVKVTHYGRVGILLCKWGTEDVDALGLQLLQAQTNGGTAAALSVPVGGLVAYKTGTLTSQTTWTKVAVTAAIDGLAFGATVPTGFTRVVADVNTNALMLYAEFDVQQAFDVDGGYDWFTAFVEGDNVDNTCLLTCFAILMDGRFPQATPLSAIS